MTNDIERAARALLEAMDRSKAPTDFVTATKKDALRSALAHAARGEPVAWSVAGPDGQLLRDGEHPFIAWLRIQADTRATEANVWRHRERGPFHVVPLYVPTPPPATGEGVEKARREFYEAARAYVDSVYGDVFQRVPKWHVAAAAYDALLAAERSDPRRGEDGAAIDAQDPMAEYVAASIAWWLDESPEAERMEGETWKRFHNAYYRLPVSVRMGAR